MPTDLTNTTDPISEVDEIHTSTAASFTCPNCGKISQDDVIFLCNKCSREDVTYTDGLYLCPSCLEPGENFECMKCDSKQVTMNLQGNS